MGPSSEIFIEFIQIDGIFIIFLNYLINWFQLSPN